MNREQALEFLRKHQPLARDDELSESLLQTYHNVLKFFQAVPDDEAIPLLLNSFGDGSGFGLYQLVEDVIIKSDREVVIPHLCSALISPHTGVRYWCAQIAQLFADYRLVQPLVQLMSDPSPDIRYAALTALEQQEVSSLPTLLRRTMETETDPEVLSLYSEMMRT